jgi:hypothetical protein
MSDRAEDLVAVTTLARWLGNVFLRRTEGAPLNYVSDGQIQELTDWEAEKYRQALNAR